MASLLRRARRSFDRFESAKDAAEQVLGGAGDALDRLRAAIDTNAPGLGELPRHAVTAALLLNPSTAGGTGTLLAAAANARMGDPETAQRLISSRNPLTPTTTGLQAVTNIGERTVEEPVLGVINRRTGVTDESLPLWARNGAQRRAAQQAAAAINNPLAKTAALTGIDVLDLATDPLTYLPVGKATAVGKGAGIGTRLAATGVNLGAGVLGVGGFGGKNALQNLGQGVVQSIGAEAGKTVGQEVGGTPGAAVGSLVGGLGLSIGASRAPGLRRLYDLPALPKSASPILSAAGDGGSAAVDPLLAQARALADANGNVTAVTIQRALKVGYPRAARLADQVQEEARQTAGVAQRVVPPVAHGAPPPAAPPPPTPPVVPPVAHGAPPPPPTPPVAAATRRGVGVPVAPLVGAAVGGAAGYTLPADSEQERARNALLLGVAGAATPKVARTAKAVAQDVLWPATGAPPELRTALQKASGLEAKITHEGPARQARLNELGAIIEQEARIDPTVALAVKQRMGIAGAEDPSTYLMDWPRIVQRPADYTISPKGLAAIAEWRALQGARQKQIETLSGFDATKNALNRVSQGWQRIEAKAVSRYQNVYDTAVRQAEAAARPHLAEAQRFRRLAERLDDRANMIYGTASTSVNGNARVQLIARKTERVSDRIDAAMEIITQKQESLARNVTREAEQGQKVVTAARQRPAAAYAEQWRLLNKVNDRFANVLEDIANSKEPRDLTAVHQKLKLIDRELDSVDVTAQELAAALDRRAARNVSAAGAAVSRFADTAATKATQAEARAQAAQVAVYTRAGQQMATASQRATKAVQESQNAWNRLMQGEPNYVHQVYDRPLDPFDLVAGRKRTLGTQQGFMHTREFADFDEAWANGYRPKGYEATGKALPAGDYDLIRNQQQARAVADLTVVAGLKDELLKPVDEAALITSGGLRRVAAVRGEEWVREHYTRLDADAIKVNPQVFEDVRAQLIRDGLAQRAFDPRTQRYIERALLKNLPVSGPDFYIKKDWARILGNFYGQDTLSNTRFGEPINQVFGSLRGLRLGIDTAMVMRTMPSGTVQTIMANPLNTQGYLAPSKLLYTLLKKGEFERLTRSDAWNKWIERGLDGLSAAGTLAAVPDHQQGKLWLESIPVLSRPIVALERWQFGTFLPAWKFFMAEAIERGTAKRYGKLDADVVGRDIAHRLNVITTGVSREAALQSRNMEWVLRNSALLSPSLTRGAVAQVTDLFAKGPRGDLARRMWVGTGLLVTALSAATTMALSGDFSWANANRLLNPASPDAVTNPTGSNFLKVALPNGDRVDVWGPVTPVLRTALRPLYSAAAEAAAAGQQGDTDHPLHLVRDMVGAGLMGLGGEGAQSAMGWARSRASLPLSGALDIRGNEDFRGRAITNSDESGGRWQDRLAYLGGQAVPSVLQGIVNTDRQAVPELRLDRWWEGIVGATGTGYRNGREVPDDVDTAMRGFLEANHIPVRGTPYEVYQRSREVLPRTAYDTFEARNPQVRTFLEQQTAQRAANVAVPTGKEAYVRFQASRNSARAERDQQLSTLNERFSKGELTGNQYRQLRSSLMTEYVATVNGIARGILGNQYVDPEQRKQYTDWLYSRSGGNVTPVEDALDALQTMAPRDATNQSLREFARARRAFLTTGELRDGAGAVVQRFSPEVMAQVRQYKMDLLTDPVDRAYAKAADAWGEYTEMPSRLGISIEDTDAIAALRLRARQRVQYGLAPSGNPDMAILMDRQATSRQKFLALYVWPSLPKNIAKDYYQRNHPEMGAFYSDLIELVDDMEAA